MFRPIHGCKHLNHARTELQMTQNRRKRIKLSFEPFFSVLNKKNRNHAIFQYAHSIVASSTSCTLLDSQSK